jgi:nucleoside-diphosphate-sugar epimerase
MRIVITGATSFVGAEFTRLVVECGHEVYAVCRNEEKAKALFKEDEDLHLVKASLSEYANLDTLIPVSDVFIHFAWDGTKVTERDLQDVHQNNIRYTMEAMSAAKRMGCSLFVDMGSQAEYGTVLTKITEETPCHPFSEYGKAKLAVFKKGVEYSKEVGIKYLHLRIFSIFGENDHPHTLVKNGLQKMRNDEVLELSDCTQKWNFLYVRDAVQQIHRLVASIYNDASFTSGVYNIASQDTRILKEFVLQMKEVTRSKSQLVFGALKPANLVSLDPDITKTFQRIGFTSNYTFEEAIKKIVQVNPTKLNEVKIGGGSCLLCGDRLGITPLLSIQNMPSSAQNIPS